MHQLPFETLTQFVALGLTLVGGWFLGMASHSGGAKWRERYQDEALDHAGYRDRAEQELRDAHRKIKALEAENARLSAAATPPAVAAPDPVASKPADSPAPAPADSHA
ncbi:hypothetical protein [Sphingomonas hengshuiensis]|uniref:hypothetical protein n=1 Tax=Sphingomonas hengshuiensis TaxID=1609977 RepID=UPI000696E853|nr:hypothetical protein [Sphingomonas hengshuiensis]